MPIADGGRPSYRARWSDRIVSPAMLAALLAAVFLAPMAIFSLVDNDEGFYGLAAKLVMQGEVPYQDFFFPQSPVLPYAYGAWMQLFGFDLYAARALSAICAIALAALVAHHAATRFGGLWAGVGAATLLVSTRLAAEWLVLTKTYALSTLLLFAAYMVIDRAPAERTPRRWLLAGVLLGLAIDVRLIFAATLPVFAFALWRTQPSVRLRAAGRWVVGLALGLLPSFILLAAAPRQFVFGNIGWASVRSDEGLIGDIGQKLEILEQLLVHEPQYAALVALAALAVGLRLAKRRPPPLAFWLALALGLTSLLPTPSYSQYFCTTVPFLILTALELVPLARSWLSDRPDRVRLRGWALAVAGVIVIAFAVEGARGVEQTYRNDSRVHGAFGAIKVSSMTDLADVIDSHIVPGEPVLSFREAYVFLSEADPVPGFENHFAPVGAELGGYSLDDARELRLITNRELRRLIADHRVRLIVGPGDSRFVWGRGGRPWDRFVSDAGYRPLGTYDATTIFIRPEEL